MDDKLGTLGQTENGGCKRQDGVTHAFETSDGIGEERGSVGVVNMKARELARDICGVIWYMQHFCMHESKFILNGRPTA